ncbi:MAG: glycerophosphodiester phosphodiesterase [Actinomycetota bacterium]|nr:glycerophosphodiester phosphodiesterase [Actinomycetota bacterium]
MASYPTLLSELAKIPGVRLWPEIKVDQTTEQNHRFVARLTEYGLLSGSTITSFSGERLVAIRAAALDLGPTNVTTLLYEAGQPTAWSDVATYHVQEIGPSYYTVNTPDFISNARAGGLAVAVYNADRATRWAEVTNLGVDNIITRYPDAAQKWQQTVPPPALGDS